MQLAHALLTRLADAGHLSAGELGRRVGVESNQLPALVDALRNRGLGIAGDLENGYRLESPIELLDSKRVRSRLGAEVARLVSLEILSDVGSTNQHLLNRTSIPTRHACLAEGQFAGRGQRGRSWISPYARNVYLSVVWPLGRAAGPPMGLSLAIGVAAAEALELLGAREIGIKWPNDLVWRGKKLAGILVELAPPVGAFLPVVIGIGLNVSMSSCEGNHIGRDWCDLSTVAGRDLSRNVAAGVVLDGIGRALMTFEQSGFAPFRARFGPRDALQGRAIQITDAGPVRSGKAAGIDATGALLLATKRGVETVLSGHVALQPSS